MKKRLLIALVVFIFTLTACGSATEAAIVETKEEIVVEKVEETVAKEVAKEEVVEETVVEEESETVIEVETYETALAWAKAVKEETPKLTIWNALTKQGTVLENGQKYLVKEGDNLVLCGNFEGSLYTDMNAPMLSEVLSTSIHQEYEFTELPANETDIYILLEVNDEKYELSLTIGAENATSTVSAGLESTDMSGKDWASSMNYEEPKLLAWNDETGTKEVIDEGGQYNMSQGDVLAIYCPTGYFVTTGSPIEFVPGYTVINNFFRIEYVLPSESQTVDLEVEVMDPEQEFITLNFTVNTP